MASLIRRWFQSTSGRCVLLHALLVAIVMAAHIATHGGLAGDAHSAQSHIALPGVIFNRWTVDTDPVWPMTMLVWIDLPAAVVAHAIWTALQRIPQLQGSSPLGISAPTLPLLLLAFAGFIQWGITGALIDRYRHRRRSRRNISDARRN